MARSPQPAWSGSLDRATLFLAALAGVALLFMVVVIAVGVIARYLLGEPILGSNEIVQMTAVALVMLALPLCTARRGHVCVDVFDVAIGRWGRLFGDLASRLLSGFVLAVLVKRAALKSLDALKYGDATNMLGMPIWPFYAVLAAGMALCILTLAAQLLLILGGGGER